jgi:hypothetical protein
MKKKKYHNVGMCPKSEKKNIIERENSIPCYTNT